MTTETDIEVHPIQQHYRRDVSPRVPAVVTRHAYEVYCEVYRPQPALVTGQCRGGFGTAELLAFLYARSFPKAEWQKRVDEAMRGMRVW